jgi:hypothetical protein
MLKLIDQQRLHIAELPEDFRVVGHDSAAPLVRKPNGQIVRVQPNCRLVAATVAAKRRLAGPGIGTSPTAHETLDSSRSVNR